MKHFLAMACASALLAACASGPGQSALTPRQSIYAAQGLLVGLESAATAYATLPRCGPPGLVVCSDRTVLAKLIPAKDAARASVNAAVAIARDPAAAQDKLVLALHSADAAVRVLQALVPAPALPAQPAQVQ